jgi:protein SCO1/2
MSEFDRSVAPKGRRRLLAGLAAAALLAGAVFLTLDLTSGPRSQPQSEAIGGPFALTAGNGQKLTDRDVRGKWLLMYFGYTRCPDICPTTLAEISETLKSLGPLAGEIQPLFITIDPERDTPDVVGTFVDQFDPLIIGLSGTAAEIAAVAKEYHVYYARSAASAADGDSYFMEHTAFVYVMGPDGKYATLFSPLRGQTPDDMAAKLRTLIARPQSG